MFSVLTGVQTMTVREVRMVASRLMIARLGMLRRFAMMLGGRIGCLAAS
jgi:hypothetical protein